jgi:Ca2+-binding RTX toxin-like protein
MTIPCRSSWPDLPGYRCTTRLLLLGSFVFAALTAALVTSASAPAAPSCLGKRATIVSSAAKIVGGKAPDVIVVQGARKHTVDGMGGNDKICGGPGEDKIEGGKGVDSIEGGAGNDSLVGGKGPDRLDGGAGDDYVNGAQGSDKIEGGEGNDDLLGDKGNDSIEGGGGDDKIEGGPGDDMALDGGPGTDTIDGGAGSDNVDGGPGNGDIVRGDAGTDMLDGGPGTEDIVSYESATRGGIQVSLAASQAKGDGHDTLGGFEDVVGSPQGDTIVGDGGPNRLDGGVGDDTLSGDGGADDAFGGPGTDACSGFAAENSCGPETSPPSNSAYAIVNQGLAGASLVVQGSEAADDLRISLAPAGWVISDNGAVFPGEGCSNPGGNSTAVACPAAAAQALIVVTGGGGNDTITIDPSVPASAKVRINGNAGSDTLVGGAGDDVLEAGENYNGPDDGNDTLVGNGGSDVLYADPGGDTLQGGPGDDLLVSSVAVCQGHTFDGGAGNDTVSYARSNAALNVELGGTAGPAGCGTPDHVLADSESLEGSDGPDVLVGNSGDNSFLGHLGADTFIGKGGNDFIDAIDGQHDKKIDCGPGDDEVIKDSSDPAPVSC